MDRIKNLQKRVLELELALANVDEFTKRTYLNAFSRMNIDSEESFDKYMEDTRRELNLSDGVSRKQTPEQIKEVVNHILDR
jgi:hypothetical protein